MAYLRNLYSHPADVGDPVGDEQIQMNHVA